MEKRNLTRSLLKKGLLSLFAFLLVGSSLQAQNVATTTPLPAFITTGAPFNLTFPVPAINAGNNSLEVTLSFDHTWASDLEFSLTDPSGNTVALVADQGGGTDMTGSTVTFSPVSANPNTDFGTCAGGTCDILPQDDFGCLLVTQGNWIININDDAGGDDGNITAASINFINDPNQAPPASFVFNHAPFAGTGTPAFFNETSPVSVQFAVTGETYEGSLKLDIDMDHTFAADILATLVAPDGSSIQIFAGQGGGNDLFQGNIITVTDCGADGSNLGVCGPGCEISASGGNLALFTQALVANNGSVNGTWTLNFVDQFGGDSGNIHAASISFGGVDCIPGGPLGVPTMSQWGLFLFFLVTLNLGLVFMYKMVE